MSNLTGLTAVGDYAGAASNTARVDVLLNMLPDPNASIDSGTGSVVRGAATTVDTYLDEVSMAALARLRVELLAMKAAITNA